jgi:mono/diheme cytochrome c family protein
MKTRQRFGLAVGLLIAVGSLSRVTGEPVAADSEPVTFNRHIAPLVFEHCAVCHRPGQVAPFTLLSYADLKKRGRQIQSVTAERVMPPWKSVTGHGQFVGERRLSPEQIALIERWVRQGMLEGDARDLPQPPRFAEGWTLGPPDLVITMPEPFEVTADGPDIYRNFVLDLSVPEGKYIKAVEYRPGNRSVVHHAAFASDPTGKLREKDAADPAPGFAGGLNIPGQLFPGSLAVWAPGHEAVPLPEGFSLPWKSGADLVLQLHLHPSGKPEKEQSTIGFHFTEEPPRRSMADLLLIDKKIDIPPGDRAYRTHDEVVLPAEMDLLGIFPHMHLIGRQIKITAHPPEGEPYSLIWIDDWDFNWQSYYQCAQPVKIAAGTKLVLEAVHDNSVENFRNPSQPPRRVKWGEQTTDEMSVAILQLTPTNEADLPKLAPLRPRIVGGILAQRSK